MDALALMVLTALAAYSLAVASSKAAGALVLAPQATGFELLTVDLHALGRIALLLALLFLVLLLLLDLLLRLIALFVAVLDYLLGDALAAEAERYGRGQRNTTQQDQERRRYKLGGYPELGQGREGRKHDDAVLRGTADDVAPVAPRTIPATKLARRVASTRIRIAAMICGM